MISDEDVEKAIDYLRDNAENAAKARAERIYMDEFRKSLKALIMKEHIDATVSAQEREAYADPRYQTHLEALRQAVYRDEKARFMRIAAEAKIEAWRTSSANQRAISI
tara:strand:- start:83 stop:406 length:324 start_codon:yes stop_codon:yes gene_type:complete